MTHTLNRDRTIGEQDGIGNMKITPSGIQLNGEAMVLDTLITSHISAKDGQPLIFDSSQNITLNARDDHGRTVNKIFLGKNKSPKFQNSTVSFGISNHMHNNNHTR